MNNFTKKLLATVQVPFEYYEQCDTRDKNLIMIFCLSLPFSAGLAGYALFILSSFLLTAVSIASFLGILAAAIMFFHDRSMLSTNNIKQVIIKLVLSIMIAISFTIVKNVEENAPSLRVELEQQNDAYNNTVTQNKNRELEAIDEQERSIMKRIESAAAAYPDQKQLLYDARRTLKSFQATKAERKQRIIDMYDAQYRESNISQTDILALQVSKLTSFSKDTWSSLLIAFVFFLFEALPAIIRIALNGGTFMSIVNDQINRDRSIRSQKSEFESLFMQNDGDDITPLLDKKILDAKTDVYNGRGGEETMAYWSAAKDLWLREGVHPFLGRNMDNITAEDLYGSKENGSNHKATFSKNSQNDQDAVVEEPFTA